MEKTKKWAQRMLCIALALMVLSTICVSLIQTGGGSIEVKHMYWETEAGIGISANIYIPSSASAETPAPAVVTSHGYLNNKEMQDANAVELSRRGYVVIAVDQPGCGFSDTADYAGQKGNGMNFISVYQAALELSRLPFVDHDRIGVTGHSMGGMSCTSAVMSDNESENPVISAVLLNCIDAVYTDFPYTIGGINASGVGGNYINLYGSRDVGIIVSKYDEFFHKRTDANGNRLDAPHFFENNNPDAQSFLHFGKDPMERYDWMFCQFDGVNSFIDIGLRQDVEQKINDHYTAIMMQELAARADWSAFSADQCNHAPIVTAEQLDYTAKAGETVTMRGSATDPDGDSLTFNWWTAVDSCKYEGNVELVVTDNKDGSAKLIVPADAAPGDCIVVNLEVQDDAERPMTRYAQIVINVK